MNSNKLVLNQRKRLKLFISEGSKGGGFSFYDVTVFFQKNRNKLLQANKGRSSRRIYFIQRINYGFKSAMLLS
jgi:hypothetical protein